MTFLIHISSFDSLQLLEMQKRWTMATMCTFELANCLRVCFLPSSCNPCELKVLTRYESALIYYELGMKTLSQQRVHNLGVLHRVKVLKDMIFCHAELRESK